MKMKQPVPHFVSQRGKLRTFKFKGWVHPREGGDDKQFLIEIQAFSQPNAEVMLKSWLKRKSDIITDYKLFKVI